MNLGLNAQELHWSKVQDSWKCLMITFQVKFTVEVGIRVDLQYHNHNTCRAYLLKCTSLK